MGRARDCSHAIVQMAPEQSSSHRWEVGSDRFRWDIERSTKRWGCQPVRNGFRSRLVVVVALVAYSAPALYAQVDGDAGAKTNIRKRLVGAGFPRGDGGDGVERGDYENAIRFFSIALEKSAPESRTFYGRGAANSSALPGSDRGLLTSRSAGPSLCRCASCAARRRTSNASRRKRRISDVNEAIRIDPDL